ncbi:MAG: hypothetical protein K1X79_04215 [Oligoflexia bacterium]|nr:hypothetical protein [Oligoflexia bacterium]
MPNQVPSFYRGPDVPDFTRPQPVGREQEVERLRGSLLPDSGFTVATIVAPGGVGKSDVLRSCIGDETFLKDQCKFDNVLYWSFYSQGSSERVVSCDSFFEAALDSLGVTGFEQLPPAARAHLLANTLASRRILVCLDGLEPLQYSDPLLLGRVKDNGLATFLRLIAESPNSSSKLLITTRLAVTDLACFEGEKRAASFNLDCLSPAASIALLKAQTAITEPALLLELADRVGSHAYSLLLLRNIASQFYSGDYAKLVQDFSNFPRDPRVTQQIEAGNVGAHAFHVFAFLSSKPECSTLVRLAGLLGLFDRPVHESRLATLRTNQDVAGARLSALPEQDWNDLLTTARSLGLLYPAHSKHPDIIDGHALVREYFGPALQKEDPVAYKAGCMVLGNELARAESAPFSTDRFSQLYQAVRYFCMAGDLDSAFHALDLAWNKSAPSSQHFPGTRTYGLHGLELVAMSHFFGPDFLKLGPEKQALLFVEGGIRFRNLGRIQDSINAFESAHTLIQSSGLSARPEFAQGLCGLCDMYAAQGDLYRAIRAGEAAVAHADQAGAPFQRALARSRLAEALLFAQQDERATQLNSEALQIFAEMGQSPLPESQALYTAALLACRMSQEGAFLAATVQLRKAKPEAPSLLGRAIRRLADAEVLTSLAERSLTNPGHALALADIAWKVIREGLPLADQAGYADYVVPALKCAARIAKLTNRHQEASDFAQRAERLAQLHGLQKFLMRQA